MNSFVYFFCLLMTIGSLVEDCLAQNEGMDMSPKAVFDPKCPKAIDTGRPCGENEELVENGPCCVYECKPTRYFDERTGLNDGQCDPLKTVTACFCKPGYVKSAETGKCIPRYKCPFCGYNELLVNPTPICEYDCDSLYDRPNCLDYIDQQGCICYPGFVRNQFGTCVMVDDCAGFQEAMDPNDFIDLFYTFLGTIGNSGEATDYDSDDDNKVEE